MFAFSVSYAVPTFTVKGARLCIAFEGLTCKIVSTFYSQKKLNARRYTKLEKNARMRS